MKQVVYCTKCNSSNVWRDAAVSVNDPDDVATYDSTFCSECGYDGSYYNKTMVPDDFEVGYRVPVEYRQNAEAW